MSVIDVGELKVSKALRPVVEEIAGIKYWSEDDPGEPEPFEMAEVNRELAGLGRVDE